eukprot:scaffold62956_cov48-Phaeocystis_antarctica.AAC.1
MSTGKVRPGILKTGTLPKNALNLSESMVAEVTMSLRSRLRATTFLRMPKSTSVLSERSWASSMIIAEYWSRSGVVSDSRSNTPSVMYLTTVRSEVTSSKRIE